MESNRRRRSRSRQDTSRGTDYISRMPIEVLLHIFYFLPLKYWIVMSLVSKQWKYIWTQISILNLDEAELVTDIIRKEISCLSCIASLNHHICQCHQHAVNAARRKFAEIVDRILLFHSGCTVEQFRLSCHHDNQEMYAPTVDKWVQFSMTSNIIELELDFSPGMPNNYYEMEGLLVRRNIDCQPYALPRHAFEPKLLKVLTLSFCKFEASSYGAFKSLKRLSLYHVDILDCSIGDLVSKCPALEDLSLKYCFHPEKFFVCKQELKIQYLFLMHCMTENRAMFPIDIITPNLLILTIIGSYLMSTSVKRATKLINVTIDIEQRFADHAQGNFLASLLLDLFHCHTLALSSWCIQEVFQDMIPNIFEFEAQSYWESQNSPFHCLQNCLKKVKIYGFVGQNTEMEMVKFLLENGTVLETLDVYYYGLNPWVSTQEALDYKWFQFQNLVTLMTLPKARSQARSRRSAALTSRQLRPFGHSGLRQIADNIDLNFSLEIGNPSEFDLPAKVGQKRGLEETEEGRSEALKRVKSPEFDAKPTSSTVVICPLTPST
ncbi:hypothetical protein RJ640_004582 [Escallonia rubra]|uniref:F-box domain-containing protein n=1 Tax=Escallonia rubra TaxID=112253 RepID=A0AA88R9R8_9ASTE|nr:hypothetical protein RJ640_004582 [Escallonia rubra]